jgi:hypothetical protein
MAIIRKDIFIDLDARRFKYVREGELLSYPMFVHDLAEKLAPLRDQICTSVFMSLSFFNAEDADQRHWGYPHAQTFKPRVLWPRKNSSAKTLRANLNKLWDAKLAAVYRHHGLTPNADLFRSIGYPARLKLSFTIDAEQVAETIPKSPKTAWDHING